MEPPLPTRCPLCEGRVHIERVRCEACASAVEGRFGLDWLGHLSREQLQFVKVFLLARGKIKDVEQALGLSYPTVVSRLDDVVAAMGGAAPVSAPAESAARLEILDQLASGAIDVEEAERRLKKKR
ncbi:MAG: hypothetical protein AMXMBFR34_23100 [Myxococcaceae bacterium]